MKRNNASFSEKQCGQIGGILKSVLRSHSTRRKTKAARDAELRLMAIPWLDNQRRVCVRHADGEVYACICPSCNTKNAWLTGDGTHCGTPKNIRCLRCGFGANEKDLLNAARGFRDDELRVNIHDRA